MNRKLYVGNIPYEATEDDLQGLFGEVGSVASINVMRDRETGRARGFAFVEMATEAEAQNAIDQLHDREFRGRTLTVNEAKPQPARSFGGGGAGVGRRRGGGRRAESLGWRRVRAAGEQGDQGDGWYQDLAHADAPQGVGRSRL